MLSSPRVWLYAAGGWLVLAGLAHTGAHVWTYVLENGLVGQREFAMNAMKQAYLLAPLQPTMWTMFRAFSVSFSLLLLFSGSVGITLARIASPPRVLRSYALLGTVFWTAAFIPFAFVDPVLQQIVVAAIAVPLHALAWLTADQEVKAESGRGERPAVGGA